MRNLTSAEVTQIVEARFAAEQRDCGCYLGSPRKAKRRIRQAVLLERDQARTAEASMVTSQEGKTP